MHAINQKTRRNFVQIALVSFLFLIFPVHADSGSSDSYRMAVDTTAYAEMGNSTSYKLEVSSGLSAETYNSSLFKIVLSFFTPPPALIVGENISARMDFADQTSTGSQTLSVFVADNRGSLVSGAVVNGTVVEPDGNVTKINFTQTSAGNYTKSFNLSKTGDYAIQVSVSKQGFANISGSKSIYIGLVKLTSFVSDSSVVQGNTIGFRFTTRNTGNVNTTIVPRLFVYNSAGNLVFSKSGVSQAISGNETISLLQNNIMIWSVGSASPGTYSASGNILFVDPGGNLASTPNLTLIFNILPSQTNVSIPSTLVGGSITIEKPLAAPQPAERFVQFMDIPVLIDALPGEQTTGNIIIFNPNDVSSGFNTTIEGIPPEWFSIIDGSSSIGSKEIKTATIVLNIPKDAIPGSYQIKVHFENDNFEKDFFSVLKVNPKEQVVQTDSIISKSVKINEVKNETHFTIKVKNKEKPLESITIVENIDKSIAGNINEIVFPYPPSRIIQPDPIVEFTFKDVKSFEERNATYYVRKVVNTTAPFAFSSFEQISTIEKIAKEVKKEADYGQIALLIMTALVIIAVIIWYARRKSRIREEVKEVEKIIVRVEK
ncbi:hypothetical protein HY501_01865 [Candidatus Woesearchaeota archaeon]|nr:hypothetical protein [Candidatus Woesearchaeota archaeon]